MPAGVRLFIGGRFTAAAGPSSPSAPSPTWRPRSPPRSPLPFTVAPGPSHNDLRREPVGVVHVDITQQRARHRWFDVTVPRPPSSPGAPGPAGRPQR